MTFISSIKGLLRIRCKHVWRPAKFSDMNDSKFRTRYRLSKICRHCNKMVILTEEEFYAEFGRIANV